jgi:serine-type D-Ala-D-Ala carboxypeptidase/endopeptidase (penicillin-binding protein 4)
MNFAENKYMIPKKTNISIGLFLMLTSTLFSQVQLETAKSEFVKDGYLANASISFCVVDLKSGEKISNYHEYASLIPASTVKLFSTASAFEILGGNYQPKTRIYGTKPINEKGVLVGDLWIRGGGDVSLGSQYYNASGKESDFLKAWADSLYKLGLRKIEGSVIGDASEFGYYGAPDGWNWGDLGNYYGAGPSGLPIYDNLLKYYFKVSGLVGSKTQLIKTFPKVEDLNFNNYIVGAKSKGDYAYIYSAPFSMEAIGTGHLPINSSSYLVKGALPDSEIQFAKELRNALIAKGISVSETAKGARKLNLGEAVKRYANYTLLFTNKGESVSSVAFWTNQKSVNIFAEQLLCWVGYEKTGSGTTQNSIDILNKFWDSKIYTKGLYLKDGSGLSRSNGVSAKHYCDLLVFMSKSKNADLFKETLAVAGESGTLKGVCKGQAAHGKIQAKSGTMSRIKSYAGYADTKSGRKLAFAIIVNNYNCSNQLMRLRLEKLFNTMVSI